ncbi:hypothetical protein [Streptomyces spectabilis]|uniref:Lipoprotein n=1 Tax=Streptomyces spectabilis TaxID=68270 RepID=A0A7W8AUW9_STRST|nr:hypothetical protein [Streptomyces spectabilis]MBB5103777.1 hypothetical protein [Streptomyces spectabilis]MCI3903983.1 hypothetical protein [Streptomyces spectabilis]GGV18842.1 hypothetical protein GCM10010245_31880 [Streptomyces spectabilis]
MTTTSRRAPLSGAPRIRLVALAAAPLLALAVGCGGGDDGGGKDDQVASVPEKSGKKSDGSGGKAAGSADKTGKSAFFDAQMTYVRCMRTKAGLKDYPDPKLSGHLDFPAIEKLVDPNGGGEEYKGGKNGVCKDELLAAMNAEPKRDQQRDYESMLAHAKCMRDKGVSLFRNPTMADGNAQPGGEPDPASPRIDTESPLYKQAREACAAKLLDGLDGMQ